MAYLFVLFNAKELKLFLPLFFVLAFSIVGAKVAHGVILAGDSVETPSIQGALVSGRRAAQFVLRSK